MAVKSEKRMMTMKMKKVTAKLTGEKTYGQNLISPAISGMSFKYSNGDLDADQQTAHRQDTMKTIESVATGGFAPSRSKPRAAETFSFKTNKVEFDRRAVSKRVTESLRSATDS